ncbi:hypothetical protein BC828DRAFT_388767 [Blastocladiella britannica]|nr:hypothetical protein BC828DRAFT_388767 [Blastocladiella britannica]
MVSIPHRQRVAMRLDDEGREALVFNNTLLPADPGKCILLSLGSWSSRPAQICLPTKTTWMARTRTTSIWTHMPADTPESHRTAGYIGPGFMDKYKSCKLTYELLSQLNFSSLSLCQRSHLGSWTSQLDASDRRGTQPGGRDCGWLWEPAGFSCGLGSDQGIRAGQAGSISQGLDWVARGSVGGRGDIRVSSRPLEC